MMDIRQNVSLKYHSTMRLGGNARFLAEVTQRSDIEPLISWAAENKQPVLMIGGGSNIVWRDEGFPGLIVVNKISGYDEQVEDDLNTYITVGAGENWDSVVERSVAAELTGIEALSLIPGTAGATPVQNVGAYGQEIADTLVSIEAYDIQARQFLTIPASDCHFGYRTSRFKTTDRGRYVIISLTLHLIHQDPMPPFYRAVEDYFAANGRPARYTPAALREAVIAIRTSKLPDPAVVANNGSFFANPIIDANLLPQLQADYPNIPHWETSDPKKIKIPAAWLIEQSGFKDFHDPATGMGTWPNQPLVLINENAQSTAQLLAFKQTIIDAVAAKFQITLEQEPELLP